MIYIYICVSSAIGALTMYFYLQWAGLFRTRGEYLLAKVLGDEQMNYFCEQAASGFEEAQERRDR